MTHGFGDSGSGRKKKIPPSATAAYLSLDKAVKTLNLYMGKGSLTETAIDELVANLEHHLQDNSELCFEVKSNGLDWQGMHLDTGERTTHYYFHLFKDGLREITFLPKITREEVREFLGIVTSDMSAMDEMESEDDWAGEERDEDTVTRLWEADFPHIRYYAIDAYAEGEIYDPQKGMTRSLSDQVAEMLASYRVPSAPTSERSDAMRSAGVPSILESRGTMPLGEFKPLPDSEVEQWRTLVEGDEKLHLDRFALIWGRLVQSAGPDQTVRLSNLLVEMFEDWYVEGQWDALLRSLKVLMRLGAGEGEQRGIVHFVLQEISRGDRVMKMQDAVEEMEPEDTPKVVLFLKALEGDGIGSLCRMVVDLRRKNVIDALAEAFRARDLDPLRLHLARLGTKNEHILKEALDTLARFRSSPGVAEGLRPLLTRSEVSVRLSVMCALRGDTSDELMAALERGVRDNSKDLRLEVISHLQEMESADARNILLDRLESREFQGLAGDERRGLLTALARVGGADAEDYFLDQLGKSSLFRRKALGALKDEIRKALKAADSPCAQRVLREEGR